MSAASAPHKHVGWLPYIVAATFFMEYLDTTVIATALPQMAHSFGVGPNSVSLGMTAYMLALAIFIPASGWIADRCGSRTVFFSAIGVFTVASVLCGLSQNVAEFTAARLLQGIGGAMMVPVGRLIVVRSTEKSRMMQAISTITWPAIAAPVVGPPIGGFITTYASWRWIFLLNVPFGLAAMAVALAMVPNLRGSERKPLDLVGLLLSGTALTAILYGAELASQPAENPWIAGAIIVGGLLVGVVAFQHAKRHPHPLIDVSTLKIPTFSVTVVTGSFTRIGIGAVPYLMPLLFQVGFGLSAFKSGLLLLASALGNLGMKALTTRILQRFGFRMVSIVDEPHATNLRAGDVTVVSLFDADARVEDMERQTLALAYRMRISQAIVGWRDARTPARIRASVVRALAATAGLILALGLLAWLSRRIEATLERRYRARVGSIGIQSFEIVQAERLWAVLRNMRRGLRTLVAILLVWAWLVTVLDAFPWTRSAGTRRPRTRSRQTTRQRSPSTSGRRRRRSTTTRRTTASSSGTPRRHR